MTDAILDAAQALMSSPWIYLVLFGFAAIDAFFPVVPSESLVITAGVYAAAGEPNLAGVVAVAALGAFAGDHVSYLAGRFFRRARASARVRPGREVSRRRRRGRRAAERAERMLAERGGLILVVARYIPGGRTAVTVTMGAVRYPARAFAGFDVIAAISWGIYSALIGYLGGKAFEDNPLHGLLLGIGLALAVSALVEGARYLRRRRRRPAPIAPARREVVHAERE